MKNQIQDGVLDLQQSEISLFKYFDLHFEKKKLLLAVKNQIQDGVLDLQQSEISLFKYFDCEMW